MNRAGFTPYYRKALIPAFAVLLWFSGNIALADGNPDVQPQKEDSKKSDQEADKGDKSSPQQTPAPTADTPPTTGDKAATPVPAGPPTHHKVSMRLSGSMCYACLKDLQDELLKVKGIEKVRIDKPQMNYFQGVSPDATAWANCVVVFDDHVLDLNAVRLSIKTHAYHTYHVVDKGDLEHAPDDKDMKP